VSIPVKKRPTDTSAEQPRKPRILIVTPEITYLPEGMGNLSQRMNAKAGGMADVSASLVSALFEQDADVHVAIPNYRRMFQDNERNYFEDSLTKYQFALPEQHIHLAQDRVFYHRSRVYSQSENQHLALAFQREVINNIIPRVQPDLIHCNDWMTGLIPAFAKHLGIKTLFTAHNIHTEHTPLAEIEDRGIDAAAFWQHCYFTRTPYNYEESRESNSVDLLTTGIFASDFVNTVSPKFLSEVVDGVHSFIPHHICNEFWAKCDAGCANGILNAPDEAFNPATDPYLDHHFEKLGLAQDEHAPLFFWPSRLDPMQKGPQLLTHILHDLTLKHPTLQIALIANGGFQQHFVDIVEKHNLGHRVAVVDFSEDLSHLGYAGSDFMIMPSRFEPCGLPQMVSPKYGTLAVAHNTGGIHDTVDHLNPHELSEHGNGFLFDHYSAEGLSWAIDQAIDFSLLPPEKKNAQLKRIIEESAVRFSHTNTAKDYISLYESMLGQSVTG